MEGFDSIEFFEGGGSEDGLEQNHNAPELLLEVLLSIFEQILRTTFFGRNHLLLYKVNKCNCR